MSNLLDLRKKVRPQIRIVRQVIIQKQPWYFELLKVAAVIVVVSTAVWGISKADEVINPASTSSPEAMGIYGTIDAIDAQNISLVNAQGTDFLGRNSFTADLSNLKDVEDSNYSPLTLADLQVGDQIIAKGFVNGGTIDTQTIISFSQRPPLPVATTTATAATATSTLDVVTSTSEIISTPTTATSTDDIATTTSDVTSSTTEEVASTTTDVVVTSPATTTPEELPPVQDQIDISTASTTN